MRWLGTGERTSLERHHQCRPVTTLVSVHWTTPKPGFIFGRQGGVFPVERWPRFIPHPTGHIRPHSDAIRVCQKLPSLHHLMWTLSFVGRCWLLFCILSVVDRPGSGNLLAGHSECPSLSNVPVRTSKTLMIDMNSGSLFRPLNVIGKMHDLDGPWHQKTNMLNNCWFLTISKTCPPCSLL